MRYDLNPAQKGRLFDQFAKLVHVTGRGNRSYDRVRRGLQDLIDGRFVTENNGVDGLFVSPAQQIDNVRQWNHYKKWGFKDEDFDRVAAAAPDLPTGNLEALVLVPYLRSRKETFEQLLHAIYGNGVMPTYGYANLESVVNVNSDLSVLDKSDKTYVRSFGAGGHGLNLRWHVLSLGANRGALPQEVEDEWLAGAEVLAAAAHFPDWVRAMDGRQVPLVWLGGYRLMCDAKEFDVVWRFNGRIGAHTLLYFDTASQSPCFRIPDARFGDMCAAVPTVLS